MQIHTDWRDIPPAARGCALALGNFDGVHRGHLHLLQTGHAARPDAPMGVLTFEPHPREVFRPEDPPFRLMTRADRAAALATQGVRHLFEIGFDQDFSDMSAERFVAELLHERLGAVHVACGADFAFGHRRGGDAAFLSRRCEQLGIGVSLVPQLKDGQGPISSTRIRRALQDGYPEHAAALLGRPWTLTGPVEHGQKRGRTIGFPTANMALGRHIEPRRGVYAVRATLPDGAMVGGVANLGRRPTVNDGTESRLETHLFDYDGDLYGRVISVALIAFLRPEQKFASFEALRAQILADAGIARALLDRQPTAPA